MHEIEYRTFGVEELRAEHPDGDAPKIVGHAAVFNSPSEDLGGFTEVIARGAFKESIKSDDIRGLFNHDPNFVLGRNGAGTLRLKEDRDGLLVEIDPPDTQWAKDLMVSINRGDITQMSFGFRTIDDEWSTVDGGQRRKLKKAQLSDVSPVTFPAFAKTDVALRSLDAWQKAHPPDKCLEDAERELRLAESEA